MSKTIETKYADLSFADLSHADLTDAGYFSPKFWDERKKEQQKLKFKTRYHKDVNMSKLIEIKSIYGFLIFSSDEFDSIKQVIEHCISNNIGLEDADFRGVDFKGFK